MEPWKRMAILMYFNDKSYTGGFDQELADYAVRSALIANNAIAKVLENGRA